jgi:tocopherol cyclase
MNRLNMVWHPELFHGRGHRSTAFDGWYFKIVDKTERHVWAIIVGVWMDRDPDKQYCFIQFLDGVTGRTTMHRYPVEQFWSSRDHFDIVCGRSRFSLTEIHVDVDEPELHLQGNLQLSASPGWPVRAWAPGAMGPLAFLPFLEGYHGVLSLEPRLSGVLSLDGEDISFIDGKGYVERDWGSAFPRAWTWTQCNHFDEDHVCLSASIADIPLFGNVLRGIIVAFLYQGTLYRWATWNGSRLLSLRRDDEHAEFEVTNGYYGLEVWSGGHTSMGQVFAPRAGAMVQMLVEELSAIVQVRLVKHGRDGDTVIFEGRGRNAGLEISGDMPAMVGRAEVEQASTPTATSPGAFRP